MELLKRYMSGYGFSSLWLDIWGKWHSGEKFGEPIIESTPIQTILQDNVVEWYHPLFAEAGPLGVVFFFVLSGFLITYLLFKEREVTGSISIKSFYIRRFLRIWPLYYLVVIIGFLVIPMSDYFQVPGQSDIIADSGRFWGSFVFFMLIFPNLAMSIFGPFPNIGQLWSIGVEEQFYIGWPWLMKKARNHVRTIFIFIVGFVALKGVILILDDHVTVSWWHVIMRFFAMTKLESMAIGGLGAWALIHERKRILNLIYHRATQWSAIMIIPVLLYLVPAIVQNGAHIVYSLSFLVIIMNVSTNLSSVVKLERKVLNFLGRISYGVYMYHMMIIIFVLHLSTLIFPFEERTSGLAEIFIYLTSIGLTILVSYLSYVLVEERFIRLKSRYAKITSGEDAKKA